MKIQFQIVHATEGKRKRDAVAQVVLHSVRRMRDARWSGSNCDCETARKLCVNNAENA